ncbi:hypothetical protein ACS0TY_030525 [Phlomoides rotata]
MSNREERDKSPRRNTQWHTWKPHWWTCTSQPDDTCRLLLVKLEARCEGICPILHSVRVILKSMFLVLLCI